MESATRPGRIIAPPAIDATPSALFEAAEAWQGKPGEQCRLQVELSEDTPIYMQATVMHVEGRNIGLRCDEIDIDSITTLRRVIELNAADPVLLERELGALVQGD